MKRLLEIRARKAEIRNMLNGTEAVDIDALENELRALDDEQAGIERRQAVAAGINEGNIPAETVGQNPAVPQERQIQFSRDTVLATPEYRSAFALTLLGRRLNETEQRALNVANTTTATTYVAATASPDVDGVNNGGLFIPEGLNLALLAALGQVSPIFRDAAKTAVPGVLKFPYKISNSEASGKAEGTANNDIAIRWGELSLSAAEISDTLRVSWKLEVMAVDQFMSYLERELIEIVQDETITQAIYGTGTNEMRGVTLDAQANVYTGSALDGIETGLALLNKKNKIGAKIYVSQSIVEEISFSKDAEGGYVFSPLNGMGVNSIATYPVEVDPYLEDGDFVIGNMGRNYRINTIEALTVTKDVSGKNRYNEYTPYTVMGGAGVPNAFVYGSKT